MLDRDPNEVRVGAQRAARLRRLAMLTPPEKSAVEPESLTPSELPAVVSSLDPATLERDRAEADIVPSRRVWPEVSWPSIDLGHPFSKLAMLGVFVAGICGLGAHYGVAPASANVVAAAGGSASANALPSSPPTHAVKVDAIDVDPLDLDENDGAEAPTPKRGASAREKTKSKRSVSHAPDAKAGETTGFRDGNPVRVTLTIVDGKPVEVRTAAAFQKMRAAAQKANISLVVVSGFRTMERQRELYADYKEGRGHLAAVPGFSNHQSGQALDLAVQNPKVRAWLEAHASEFGFRRTVPTEPWHWEHN